MASPTKSPTVLLLFMVFLHAVLWIHSSKADDISTAATGAIVRCPEAERQALLRFKAGLIDYRHRLSSWRDDAGEDCCGWAGVGCDNRTGHVIRLDLSGARAQQDSVSGEYQNLAGELDPSLLNLTHLRHLDLSYFTSFTANIPINIPMNIPIFLSHFKHLKYLNLSHAGFNGTVPHHLGNLSSLRSLDLSYGYNLIVDDARWFSRLTNLRDLDMSGIQFSAPSPWLQHLNMLPSLLYLRLSGCQLDMSSSSSSLSLQQHVNLTSLRLLDLSWNSINSEVPRWLFNLSSLQRLYLAGNAFSGGLRAAPIENLKGSLSTFTMDDDGHGLPPTLESLCKLQTLELYGDFLAKFQFGSIVSGCLRNSLQELKLEGYDFSHLEGLPDWIGNFENLNSLDLSFNIIQSSSMHYCLLNLSRLQTLDLSDSGMYGSIPDAIGSLTSLRELILSRNSQLGGGGISKAVGSLCNLQILDISWCNLTISLEELGGNISGCVRNSLQDLNLEFNSLAGHLPDWLWDLKNLKSLDLYQNSISGPLPSSLERLSSLQKLDLRSNMLNGTIPRCVGGLSELVYLDLSFNSLDGFLSEAHFKELTKLGYLDLSYNSLVLKLASDWVPPFQLEYLSMDFCEVGPQFPEWLRTQVHLNVLTLSNAGITGKLPNWFWNFALNLDTLDISSNQISGMLPNSFKLLDRLGPVADLNSSKVPRAPVPSPLSLLCISNNSFSGSISPYINEEMPLLRFLYLSMNNISGTIPSALCGLKQLNAFDVSENSLTGEVPNCWTHSDFLDTFDVSSNNLSGRIPHSIFFNFNVMKVHLSNNSFVGGIIPVCRPGPQRLFSLDLDHNMLNGSIPPCFGETFPYLTYLNLRSNMLSGRLPPQLSQLANLRILDVSHNNLSGLIPGSFGNFTSMNNITFKALRLSYMFLVNKGREDRYSDLLDLLVMINLSDNNLSGEIPEELVSLQALTTLTLSGNHLTGKVTNKIGQMQSLESLDLSRNELSGEVPPSLTNLDYLGYLNLSYNNFSGKIPSGNHLETFDSSSYLGNPDLCGLPLPKKCNEGDAPNQDQSVVESMGKDAYGGDGEEDEMFWLYMGMAPGFVVGSWAVWGVLLLNKNWRVAYIRFIDNKLDQIHTAMAIHLARLNRKLFKGNQAGI